MFTFFKPVSYKTGAALAVGATAVWKAVSFVNSILIALYFGTKAGTDVYFYLIMLIGFGLTFLQRLNSAVLIPEAMFIAKTDENASRKFLNVVLYIYLLLAAGICAAGLSFPAQSIVWLSRFPGQLLHSESALLCASFILFGTHILTAYLTAIVERYKFFGTVLLTPLNAVCPLIGLLFFWKTAGIAAMIYGFLAANLIQIIVFLILLKKQLGWSFVPAFTPIKKHARKNIVTNQLLEIMGILNSLIPIYLISGLGAGLISMLNYGKQIADAPVEIVANRVANVSKIQLTENAAAGAYETLNRNFLNTSFLLFFLLTPVAVFVCFYAYDIIALFFMRGNFTAVSAAGAARFLRPLIFMIVLLVPVLMFNNVIAATRKIKESFPYIMVGQILLSGMVIGGIYRWGGFSYPYILIAANLIGYAINYFMFKKYFPFIHYKTLFADFARILALNILALFFSALFYCFCARGVYWFNILAGGIIYMTALTLLSRVSGDLRRLLEISEASRFAKKLF